MDEIMETTPLLEICGYSLRLRGEASIASLEAAGSASWTSEGDKERLDVRLDPATGQVTQVTTWTWLGDQYADEWSGSYTEVFPSVDSWLDRRGLCLCEARSKLY